MLRFLSIALVALSFSSCATMKSFFAKVPSASVIQTDVTLAVSVARDAALVNPGIEASVNAFVGSVHSYLGVVEAGKDVLPTSTQVKADLDALIAQISASLLASVQANFTKVATDLEGVVLQKYNQFYGYVSNIKPYVDALYQATA